MLMIQARRLGPTVVLWKCSGSFASNRRYPNRIQSLKNPLSEGPSQTLAAPYPYKRALPIGPHLSSGKNLQMSGEFAVDWRRAQANKNWLAGSEMSIAIVNGNRIQRFAQQGPQPSLPLGPMDREKFKGISKYVIRASRCRLASTGIVLRMLLPLFTHKNITKVLRLLPI